MYKKTNKKNTKKIMLVLAAVLAFLAGLLMLELAGITDFYQKNSTQQTPSHEESQSEESKQTINYAPATDDEKSAAEQNKKDMAENVGNTNNPPSPGSAKPVITSAGQYSNQVEVRAFIPNIYENNGTCRAIFTQGNSTVEREVEGIKDATTTRCDTVTVLKSDFPSLGVWQVSVHYSSSTNSGVSDATTFEIY